MGRGGCERHGEEENKDNRKVRDTQLSPLRERQRDR